MDSLSLVKYFDFKSFEICQHCQHQLNNLLMISGVIQRHPMCREICKSTSTQSILIENKINFDVLVQNTLHCAWIPAEVTGGSRSLRISQNAMCRVGTVKTVGDEMCAL